MNILLLETDKFIAHNISQCFANAGHHIDWQVDPQEAIISVDVAPVELVIMDVILAGRSGIEFLYEFRSYPDWANIPVVIYSNVPQREVGKSIAGFDQINVKNYFYKPNTSIKQLLLAVNKYASALV
jgi:DNA-binding response OmpR family regulator